MGTNGTENVTSIVNPNVVNETGFSTWAEYVPSVSNITARVGDVFDGVCSHLTNFNGATAASYAIGTFCLVKSGSSAQKAWRAWKGIYNKEADASTRIALLETGKTLGYGTMAGVGFVAPACIFPHIQILN